MCHPCAVKATMGRWQVWAGMYVAAVALASVLNQLSDPHVVGWYIASVILTLPLGYIAIYPVLFLADVVSNALGGGLAGESFYGGATVVVSFIAFALLNVVVARLVVLPIAQGRALRRSSSLGST